MGFLKSKTLPKDPEPPESPILVSKKTGREDDELSHKTFVMTEKSDLTRMQSNYKLKATNIKSEVRDDDSRGDLSEEKKQFLTSLVKSKTVLSFGYWNYIRYYQKISLYNTLNFLKKLICCGRSDNDGKAKKGNSSMTKRKYRRAQNAYKKISEEVDLIKIVKTLRIARFLIDMNFTQKQ